MAFHANFSGPITMNNPARLGDAVTAYMTGLGSTIPLVETGMPGPFSPLATAPLSCTTGSFGIGEPVEVLFSGMAPGLIGIYQVNLRLPVASQNIVVVNPSLGVLNVRCGNDAASRENLPLSVLLESL